MPHWDSVLKGGANEHSVNCNEVRGINSGRRFYKNKVIISIKKSISVASKLIIMTF